MIKKKTKMRIGKMGIQAEERIFIMRKIEVGIRRQEGNPLGMMMTMLMMMMMIMKKKRKRKNAKRKKRNPLNPRWMNSEG